MRQRLDMCGALDADPCVAIVTHQNFLLPSRARDRELVLLLGLDLPISQLGQKDSVDQMNRWRAACKAACHQAAFPSI